MAVKQILGKVTVTPKGEYSSGETYKRLDIVTSNGQSYIAKVDNTGVDVTNTNTWLQLVEKPEKGIDYFTEEDIAQLVSMVTDDSESEFNEYYNGKVSDFDSNASSKTSEFNSNYDEKVESFNTIFDTSTDNFDGNYETKLSAFNENASTQTSTFNSVVEQATSDFNNNASTLTETFNTNASEKTSAFNINASEKTQEFNDNVDEKTEQITSQLDNYVQFDNYPSNEKAGVVKSHINGFQVSNDGNPNAAILSKEQYDTIENQYFISKGTLENIKDDYVGSSTPVKNLNNSLKDITPKQDAEGTDNTFEDGLKSPLFALGGDGKSEQKTTTGKNKFDISSLINRTQTIGASTGNIYTLKPNTQYTVSTNMVTSSSNDSIAIIGTPQSANAFIFVSSDTTIETISSNTNGVGTINNISRTLMTDDTGNIFVGIRESASLSLSDLISKGGYVQIEEGSQATSYEPYTGGQPSPSPDYPQEINNIEGSLEFIDYGGINICPTNFADWESGEYNTSGDKANNDFRLRLKNLIYCRSNTDFYFNLNNTTDKSYDFLVRGYDNNKSFVKNYGVIGTGSMTVDKGTAYLSITIGNADGTTTYDDYMTAFNNNELQPFVCFGGIENKTYEPYIEPNKVTFDLGQEKLRSVGAVKDELVVDLDTGDYYKVENVGEYVFDGSEEWILYSQNPNRFVVNIPSSRIGMKSSTYNAISNYYKYYYSSGASIPSFATGESYCYQIYDNQFLTPEELKTWLSTHNNIFNYELKTPTTKKLGTLSAEDLAKLKTFKGYNNVTVNTNLGLMNIRFTYGLDIKKYIDNELLQLEQNIITNLLNIMPETVQAGIVDKEVNSLIGGI